MRGHLHRTFPGEKMSNAFGPPEGQFGPPQGQPGPPQGPQGPGQGPAFGPPQGAPQGPPPGAPFGPPQGPFPPPPPRRNNTPAIVISIVGVLVLALVAVVGIVFLVPNFFDDDSSNGSSDSPGVSAAPSDSSGGLGAEPGTDATSAAPDPTESAFKDVTSGDCLPVWDTGYGGSANVIEWSAKQPPSAVSCDSDDALVQVTGTDGGCPSGTNQATWKYTSESSGQTSELCLTRIYHKGGCFLAKQENDKIVDMGPMTAVDCSTKKKIPFTYNQVMHITGVYNTSKGTDASLCRRVQGDQTQYWSWTVDDGDTLLCTMVYQG
jgi:hypothetical protein